MTPEPFGRYTLVDSIGAGGMAEVFRATLSAKAGVEKQLVVKRILRGLSAEPAFVEMFIDEARIAAQLQHPNVVQVFDFGQVDDHWFMAMEWVDGLNLHHLLRQLAQKRVHLPVDFALYVAHEAAKGLHYAHTLAGADGQPLGLVHRDICPQNLLISWRGDVKLADFGIAKSAANTYTTQGVTLKGHTSYMSPEQTRGQALDGRSDLFSLCVVLWEALTGRRLFRTDDPVLTLERVRLAEVPAPRDTRPEIPQAIEDLLLAGLAADPADRPEHARALQLGLARPLLPETPDEVRERFAAWLEEVCGELIAMSPRLRGAAPPPFEALGALPEEDEPTVIAEAPPEPTAAEPTTVAPAPEQAAPPTERAAPTPPIEPIEPSVSGTLSLDADEERRGGAWWVWLAAALLLLGVGSWVSGAWESRGEGPSESLGDASSTISAGGASGAGAQGDASSASNKSEHDATGAGHEGEREHDATGAGHEGERERDATDASHEGDASGAPHTDGALSPPADDPGAPPRPAGATRASAGPTEDPPPPIAVEDDPDYVGVPDKDPPSVFDKPGYEGTPSDRAHPERDPATPPPDDPPAIDPATPASVSVRLASGWGQLRVDGKKVRGSTPFEDLPLAPGPHLIQVEVPSTGRVWSKEILLEPGQHLDLVFD